MAEMLLSPIFVRKKIKGEIFPLCPLSYSSHKSSVHSVSPLSLLPTSPWVPASAPRGACECWGVGGVLPHVHGLPVCFRTEWSVVPCGVHQGH